MFSLQRSRFSGNFKGLGNSFECSESLSKLSDYSIHMLALYFDSCFTLHFKRINGEAVETSTGFYLQQNRNINRGSQSQVLFIDLRRPVQILLLQKLRNDKQALPDLRQNQA